MAEKINDTTAEVVRDLAFGQSEPRELEPGSIYGWLTHGEVHTVDLTGDQYRDFPKHKRGTVTVRNVASFAHYYGKHSGENSEVFADLDKGTFTAVLDAHGEDQPMWQQHRLVLALEQTLPWRDWLSCDRQMLPQQQFAEFVEDHARDVAPGGKVTAADLLEVAQSFQAHTAVQYTAGTRLASGQTQLTYKETIDAKAGNRGEVVIPSEFVLGIVPFEDCPPTLIIARFRYRITDGQLRLGYFLNDPARAAREAVALIAEKVAETCDVTVMHGRPA